MQADRHDLTSELSRQVAVLALGLAGYFASVALGGNGFVAAFLAGLAFGGTTRHAEERAELFSEAAGILLSIGVWAIFGATLVASLLRDTGDLRPVLYALLSLTVVRMAAVAVALTGSRLALPTIGFIGWFGPRGLASIVFGILAVDGLDQAGVAAPPLASTIAWTVLLSVVAHGLTAGAFAGRYGRWITRRQGTATGPLPELEERSEPRAATRSTWIRRRQPTRSGR
jgi:NhaP-type Na+/H+ or K+/H+ antiporter